MKHSKSVESILRHLGEQTNKLSEGQKINIQPKPGEEIRAAVRSLFLAYLQIKSTSALEDHDNLCENIENLAKIEQELSKTLDEEYEDQTMKKQIETEALSSLVELDPLWMEYKLELCHIAGIKSEEDYQKAADEGLINHYQKSLI
jgi:hypothetical protein